MLVALVGTTRKKHACARDFKIISHIISFRFVTFLFFSLLFLSVGTLEVMDVIIITMEIMYIRDLSETGFNNALLA